MDFLLNRVLEQPLWTQCPLGALAVLLLLFFGMILLQLVKYSVATIATQADVRRSAGARESLIGVVFLALGIGAVVVQEYLNRVLGTETVVVSLGLLAAGLYALFDGLGILLWRRSRIGVVALVWLIVGGTVYLLMQ